MAMLHGFPYWLLEFRKDGSFVDSNAIDTFVNGLAAEGISDIYVFSHGWNNDRSMALSLYDAFFGEVRKIVDTRNVSARIGVAGVIWPSILWPDDAKSAAMNVQAPGGEGAVSVAGAPPAPVASATPAEVREALKRGYDAPEQRRLIDELTHMLETQPGSDDALREFKDKLAQLLASESAGAQIDPELPDDAEGAVGTLPYRDFRRLLETMGDRARATGAGGGAVGVGDFFGKLWEGAKDVMRVGTYWQMKQRAGVIGKEGLGPRVLARINESSPRARVHLIGHSFGARLVSFALPGLPPECVGERSPVKSLLLLQGAFSHFAFADRLPHDMSRSGALAGMAARVDGPLITTHSLKDLAVGKAYPAASFVNGDDASAAEDQASRWGAMGNKGAQAVNAVTRGLAAAGEPYVFEKGKWVNLDGNSVIVHGGLPSGAHSDIVHPHTAWVALAAARVA